MDVITIIKRSENATFQTVAGEAILIDLQTGKYFSLNRVGTEFWEMLDGEQSLAQHAATLATKYNVDAEMVTADLVELAEKLVEKGLAERA